MQAGVQFHRRVNRLARAARRAEWDRPRWSPVSSPETVPSLLKDDGAFFQMVAEATARIERVREAGFEPASLDCHMGVEPVRFTDG